MGSQYLKYECLTKTEASAVMEKLQEVACTSLQFDRAVCVKFKPAVYTEIANICYPAHVGDLTADDYTALDHAS